MARVSPESSRHTMEDVLEETGWGLYYKVLIGVMSACKLCHAIVTLAIIFALPLATCDSFLNEASLLTVDMSFFFGKAIGGYLLNGASDVTGRVWLISNSLILIFCSTFLAAFSHASATLGIAMFILGSGLEANIKSTKIHLAEILPKDKRGFYLTIPDLVCSCCYLGIIGAAWKLSHHTIIDHRGNDMRLTAWRLVFALAGGVNIIIACVTALVQPSPRYRLFKKQYSQAQESLKLFYALNKSKYSETWPHGEQDIAGIISDFQINTEPEALNCWEQIRTLLRRMFKTVCLLFKRRFLSTTVTLISMKILLFMGIVPVQILLMKTLIVRKESCEIIGQDIIHLFPPVGKNCTVKASHDLFLTIFLLTLSISGGQLMVAFLVDRLGRKFILAIGFIMCSMAAYVISYANMDIISSDKDQYFVEILFCSILLGGYSTVTHTIGIIEIEAYPTAARGTAAGIISFHPNIILCLFCIFWNSSCRLIYLIIGLISAAAFLVSYFLPDMKKLPMKE